MPETYIPADLDPTWTEPAPIEAVFVAPERDEAPQAAGPLGGEIAVLDGVAEGVVYAEVDAAAEAEPIFGEQPEAEPAEATQEASGTIISTEPPATEPPAEPAADA